MPERKESSQLFLLSKSARVLGRIRDAYALSSGTSDEGFYYALSSVKSASDCVQLQLPIKV